MHEQGKTRLFSLRVCRVSLWILLVVRRDRSEEYEPLLDQVNGTTGLYTARGTLLIGSKRLKTVVKPDETIYLQQKRKSLFDSEYSVALSEASTSE